MADSDDQRMYKRCDIRKCSGISGQYCTFRRSVFREPDYYDRKLFPEMPPKLYHRNTNALDIER